MKALRRILTPWRRYAAISIAVLVVLLATMALQAVPPQGAKAAPSEDAAATSNATDEAAGLSKATAEARPDQDADIESASQKLKLHMPKGALKEQVDVEITEHGSWGPAGGGMLKVFELHAFKKGKDKKAQNEIKRFDQALTLTIQHDAQDLAGFNTDTLSLYYPRRDYRTMDAGPRQPV